jgi:hypothetical protein
MTDLHDKEKGKIEYANMVMSSGTASTNPSKYDWITDELLRWVREVPLESDAVANIPRIMKEYKKDLMRNAPIWELLKAIFNKDIL